MTRFSADRIRQIKSGVPYLILFDNSGSKPLSLVLNILLMLLIFIGNVTALATCAREAWAFARDKGLPFSGTIGKMCDITPLGMPLRSC